MSASKHNGKITKKNAAQAARLSRKTVERHLRRCQKRINRLRAASHESELIQQQIAEVNELLDELLLLLHQRQKS